MKPAFSIKYLNGQVVPAMVEFTDLYGGDKDMRITRFDFGDGTLYQWDAPDQEKVTHTYRKAGEWNAKAYHEKEMSDIVVVKTTGSTPVPSTSLWGAFIKWLKSLFGIV